MTDQDLAFTSAWEQRELIRTKQASPVDLAELYFKRIESLDSQLNSYLTLNRDEAMEQAKAAEQAVVRGDELGPLHGVPVSIKDLEITRGLRTTSGSLAYKDRVPDEDSVVAGRVRKAGATILGKTNTSEFGALGAGENRLGDHCRNPWNTDRTTGASSAGAGASMAAGLCALATGGDGGGSIRIPASFCGLYGIKPTQGRVGKYAGAGATPMPNWVSQSGPMTRTVRDSAMLLQVLAGQDPKDITTLREEPADYVAALDRGVNGLRIGWTPDYGYAAVDPDVAEVTSASARVFEELGSSVEDAELKLGNWAFDCWWVTHNAGAYASNGQLLESHGEDLTWYVKMVLELGKSVTGADYARALGQRNVLKAIFADLFEKYDLLLSPTMPITAFDVDHYPEEIAGQEVYPFPAFGFIPFTHPINTIGYPAASVPCGFSSDGMPIGLHIVGRSGDEETVLAASAAFERAKPWAKHRPPVS